MDFLNAVMEYLTSYGWKFEALDGEDALITGFTNHQRAFVIIIHIDGDWLRIVLPDILEPLSNVTNPQMLIGLFAFNSQTRLVRLGLYRDTTFALFTDIFLGQEFHYEDFELSLDMISLYAERITDMVLENINEDYSDTEI